MVRPTLAYKSDAVTNTLNVTLFQFDPDSHEKRKRDFWEAIEADAERQIELNERYNEKAFSSIRAKLDFDSNAINSITSGGQNSETQPWMYSIIRGTRIARIRMRITN
jgi:hypothetical protein